MRADGACAARRGPKPRHKVALTAPEYRELQRLTRRRTAPYAAVVRAKILLLAYEHPDWSNATIARAVGCTDRTVAASGEGAAGRGRPCRTRPGPGDHAFSPSAVRAQVTALACTLPRIPVSHSPAGRLPNSPARSSSAALSGASQALPSSAGSRPSASSRGNTTAGNAPPIRTSSNGPSRF